MTLDPREQGRGRGRGRRGGRGREGGRERGRGGGRGREWFLRLISQRAPLPAGDSVLTVGEVTDSFANLCVHVCERDCVNVNGCVRERQTDRQTDRQTEEGIASRRDSGEGGRRVRKVRDAVDSSNGRNAAETDSHSQIGSRSKIDQ